MSTPLTRRSFLGSTATAMVAAHSVMTRAHGADAIPGFDQTKAGHDRTKAWQPFSDRKIRVGLVGYGVCKFSAQFEFQNHPNIEVVAVSDLFPDRCAALSKHVQCPKTYPSLEEMVNKRHSGQSSLLTQPSNFVGSSDQENREQVHNCKQIKRIRRAVLTA